MVDGKIGGKHMRVGLETAPSGLGFESWYWHFSILAEGPTISQYTVKRMFTSSEVFLV